MRRRLITVLLALVGVALLAWQVEKVGVPEIREGFAAVGWGFGAIFAISFARFVLRSYAWAALCPEPLPLWSAVAATISGDALGNITPLGLAASEPAKAMAVARHLDPARALAALTAENFFYSVSVAIFVALSATALLVEYAVPDALRWVGVLALGAMGAILIGAIWLAWQRPTLVSALARRIPIRAVQALANRVRAFEDDAYVATRRSGALTTVILCAVAFHVLSLVECWLTLRWLTGTSAWMPALVFDGFGRVANILFKFVPGQLGLASGSLALVATAIGMPESTGYVLGFVRTARVIVWAGVGLGLYVVRKVRA